MTPCAGILVCPVCAEPLGELGRSLRCPRGHTFDRARAGYVDLLPAGHGRSRLRGDAPDMVESRRRFLARGHYAPLSDAVTAQARREAGARRAGTPFTVLDAGCGEGWYSGRLARALPSSQPEPCVLALDVSKAAVRRGARAHREVLFFVNDVKRRISVADGSVDVVLSLFAPRNAAEFGRVTRPGGAALVAVPGPRHLEELRDALPLLRIDPDKRDRTVETLASTLELEAEEALGWARELPAGDVLDLLRMSPNRWHLDESTLAGVAGWEPLRVTMDVLLLRLRRQ